MAVNINIQKSGNENSQSMLRKFSQAFRGSGLLRHVRDIRFRKRSESDLLRKKNALRKIGRRDQFEQLIKDGKLSENIRGRRTKWTAK